MFDFFNGTHKQWKKAFCEYFKVDETECDLYFQTVNPESLVPNKIVRDLNINLNDFDSSKLLIVCRHMTTATPNDKSVFRDNGIFDLKSVLEKNTVLSSFLSKHNVNVDVDNKQIIINEIKYPIVSYKDPCDYCFQGKNEPCNSFIKCPARKAMEILGLKLYHYGATVEFFVHSSYEQMKRYSCISQCPEILQTIDKIVSSVNGYGTSSYKMCYDWMRQSKKCYIIEFTEKLSNMETHAPMDYKSAWEDVGLCLQYNGYGYSDYIDKKIPQNVLDNMGFIRWFISIYFFNSEILGSLLPNLCVDPQDITKIIEEET